MRWLTVPSFRSPEGALERSFRDVAAALVKLALVDTLRFGNGVATLICRPL